MAEPIKVLVVDDHEMVRIGLAAVLDTEEDIEVVGEASGGEEALRMVQSFPPDVILMDLVMEGMDGVETTRRVMEMCPACKVVVLTSFIDDSKLYPVIEAGAFSYLLKTARAQDIADAIRAAMRGQSILEPQVAMKMMSKLREPQKKPEELLHEHLTAREMDVLRALAEGMSNQEIADKLFIGVKTVKFHVSNILNKLDVYDRTQAAIYAHKNGLAQ